MERHFLPIVAYRVAEIEGISGTIPQGVLQLDNQFFSSHLDIRRRLLRRGHQQVLSNIIELKILIESDLNPLAFEIQRTHLRLAAAGLRRSGVFRSTLRTYPTVSASRDKKRKKEDINYLSEDLHLVLLIRLKSSVRTLAQATTRWLWAR